MAKIKNVAIQMDHVSGINIAGDSTFAISLEAQARGYRLFHYTPERLSMRDGKFYATVEQMELRDIKGDHFSLSEPQRVDLSTMDVIHLRQDPPFDMAYITSTHLLERIHPKTLVVNDPVWVRNSPEKIFVTEFADLMPKTLITKDVEEIARFRNEMGDIILKPLYGNGGAGVFHSARDDRNFSSLLEMFGQMFREPISPSNICLMSARATSASCWSMASRLAPSTVCLRKTTPAPTCMPAAGRSRRN